MARQIGVTQVAPECICVPKVYDWVVITEDIKTTVSIPTSTPAGCPSIVTETTCSLGSKPFFPINCAEDGFCTVLARRPANMDGINAQIVRLRQEIPVSVTFTGTDAKGAPSSCTIPLTASFIHQVLLCFPNEFTDESLVCRIVSGDCTITTPPPREGAPLPTSIGVELLLCIEIQVLAAVKLEVLARFCAPRPLFPVTALNLCPPLLSPEQCDFFPQPNCLCQGTVNDSCTIDGDDCKVTVNGITANSGEHTLVATICDGCALTNSRVIYNFSSKDPNVPSFTFVANSFFSTSCAGILGALIVAVLVGKGTVTMGTTTISNVSYALLIGEADHPLVENGWNIFLTGPFTAEVINNLVEKGNLFARSCVRLPSPLP